MCARYAWKGLRAEETSESHAATCTTQNASFCGCPAPTPLALFAAAISSSAKNLRIVFS
ncbi:hypothetical protein Ahy_A03g014493 isoform B [Arachis hypogaea]|uniref:Uncharacterized protein n=1 Tax=Arachis hypogaea TaxID=3818 RepID=A0A445DY36_ARAHY|nr:hypothetical protein Ahy_A03g014493 isoform B [Arachis hypogaea]